jgi:acyl transferase domain-containing protein/acyl carrier protein
LKYMAVRTNMVPKDQHKNKRTGLEIAVVGMAGRFPGADNIQQFWENLKNGVESISFFSDEELIEAGVDLRLLENPNYVKAKGVLENVEYFDSPFFGYAPVEAEIMDPQVRIFHECAWEALEDAAYVPGNYSGLIGIYAGALDNFYWQGLTLLSGEEKGDSGNDRVDSFSEMILRNKDFLATRVAYKLDLKGPAVSLQTACSTSLVAIDTACRALLGGICDMALAGGVAIWYPHKSGYIYQEGMILSSDGHCRVFDAQASGTVSSEGVGVVVLKRLEEAEADGDHIYAIIKGSAINNDGTRKVGFFALGVEGQAEVINTAMYMADVEPDSIGYIETHGTGTIVGDTVEMEALKLAFKTNKKHFCALGSLKTNVGHMDTAAGVASFIKAVLVLKHRLIPPGLYFKNPNPAIDFENSPFYVNTELKEWRSETHPLRAGVSSYGIGGTNVHVVLEEAPKRELSAELEIRNREYHLILLSAKTKSALDKASENLATHLKNNLLHQMHPVNLVNPGLTLADAAYTLQVGRKVFNHRRSLVCSSIEEAVEALSSASANGGNVHNHNADTRKKSRVVFMFPDQGTQYVNMGLELYQKEPRFREEMDRCFETLKPLMGQDIKEILYPPATRNELSQLATSTGKINQTEIAQPVLFAFEYALAALLISWGITPDAMIGHSIGEYTAACLANVFSLEDALKLVALRGQLMQQMPGGSMLSLLLAKEELRPLLSVDISLAAVNSPSHCVVSGTDEAIDALDERVKAMGYQSKRLHTSHAFHSRMMEPILKPFMKEIEKVLLNKPQRSYISNITGWWASAKEAADPRYWTRHLRETVRFSDGIKTLLTEDDFIFMEVGPGKTLSTLVKHHEVEPGDKKTSITAVNLVRHPKESENVADDCYLLDKVGQLWLYGILPDWSEFHRGRRPYRLPLPTYPFERRRYPIKGHLFEKGRQTLSEASRKARKPDTADWFYVPLWVQSLVSPGKTSEKTTPFQWLVFTDSSSLGTRLVEELENQGHEIISVYAGTEFNRESEKRYTLNPRQDHDYNTLFEQLSQLKKIPRRILHLWNITEPPVDDGTEADRIRRAMDLGFYSLLNIVTAAGSLELTNEMQVTLTVVTSHLQAVTGEETIRPEKAVILGALKTISREYPHLRCRSIDILPPLPGGPQEDKLVKNLLSEFLKETSDRIDVAAWRGNHRWIQQLEPYPMDGKGDPTQHLREAGVYLVTGGLGGMGLTFAQHLAENFRARLILLDRSPFPPEEQWEEWLTSHDDTDPIRLKIRKLQEFQKSGAKIMAVTADVADIEEMQELMARAAQRFGTINGVIHAAGLADYEGVIHRRTRQNTDPLLAAKVEGTLVLDRLLKDVDLDFVILCSSLSSILTPPGEVAYNAANAFLDAFAHSKALSQPGTWISINWGAWQQMGMAVETVKKSGKSPGNILRNEILPWEGIDIFHRLLEHRLPQVAVFSRDLVFFIRRMNMPESDMQLPGSGVSDETMETIDLGTLQERPELSVDYVPPQNATQQALAHLWQRLFGLQKVGIHDDFLELGGDSLKAMIIGGRVHKKFNVKVPVTEFFNKPTIKELADYIDQNGSQRVFLQIEPVGEKEYYALSSAQKRLYFLHQMDMQSLGYNMPTLMVMEGDLNKDKLEDTFRKLIERHESLRTSFMVIDDEPVQKIHKEVEFRIEFYDLTRTQVEVKFKVKKEISHSPHSPLHFTKRFVRPFDLSRAPLLRVGLIKLEEKKHILMVDMHHIISDAISHLVLARDFLRVYAGEDLSPLRFQYKDYCLWQNSPEQQAVIKQQEAWWLGVFSGNLPVLNLPTDYPRPAMHSSEGSALEFRIGKGETAALNRCALQKGATLQMVTLAILNVLLARLSHKEDVVIGIPVAGRKYADLEKIIGLFVNTLPVRNFPNGDKTFSEFLIEVKENSLKAYENQDYPLENLVKKSNIARDMERNPLFDVMFEVRRREENAPGTVGENTSGLKLTPYKSEIKTTLIDLDWFGTETEDGIHFTVIYSTKLFKEESIKKLTERYLEIVKQVLEDEEIRLKDINVSHRYLAARSTLPQDSSGDFAFNVLSEDVYASM